MIPLFSDYEFKLATSRQKLPLQCKYCKNTFYNIKRYITNALNNPEKSTCNFCSHSCQRKFEEPPIIVECKKCGNKFHKQLNQIIKTKNNFCSKSCAAIYNNKHKTTGTRRSKFELWIEKQLTSLYPNLTIHYNKKDAIGSELDICIPSLSLAFEFNGIFHYEPIYGDDKFIRIQSNDENKFQICIEKNISLCVIDISSIKHFKEHKCLSFLKIIQNIILSKLAIPTGYDPVSPE